MASDCIFCQIVDGEIPARIVHETDDVVAFLDANPLAPAHTLVVPKAHYPRLNDVPAAEAQALYDVLHAVIPAAETAANAPASTVAFNNGSEAGQEVPHVHGHVVPRFADDGGRPIHGVAGTPPDLTEDELDALASRVSGALD
ncbi:MAG: HIT family protein [Halobacteriaceae archaeon]